jgi:uncharacterized coiled-coil DUF342 family protein
LWLKSWANTTAPTDNETYLKLVLEEVAKLAKTLKAERDEAIQRRMETILQCELLQEERDEARAKVERQAERIRILEGATNHAGGLYK